MEKYVVFGVGSSASGVFALLISRNQQVIAFADNNKDKQGSTIFGLPIVSPEQLQQMEFSKIVIASQYFSEIKQQLLELEIPSEKVSEHLFLLNKDLLSLPKNSHPFSIGEKPAFAPENTYRKEIFETLFLSVEQTFYAAVDGDIAEFGCGSRQSSFVLADAVKNCNKHYRGFLKYHGLAEKQLHLFDDFENMMVTDNRHDHCSKNVNTFASSEAICSAATTYQLTDVLSYWLDFAQFQIYKGWFSETLIKIPKDKRFSLVHLGCDLWEATDNILDYLLSNKHLSEGCILLFDDWSHNRAANDSGQRRVWNELVEKYFIDASSLGFYGLGGHRTILHTYR